MNRNRRWGVRIRAGAGAAVLLVSSAAFLAGTGTAQAATASVVCGGMDQAAAVKAGYNPITGVTFTAGTSGNDWIVGTSASDTLSGGIGDDVICGEDGADTITGDRGNDKLHGGEKGDTIYGDELGSGTGVSTDGNDFLFGDNSSDVLYGNGGTDTLRGDANPTGGGFFFFFFNGTDTCTTVEFDPTRVINTTPLGCEKP